MMPLIRNVLFVTIFIIAAIVALANMGMNVTPLLAGAGVIGLAIGFGAQSLVADLITGLFIIIEDSLAIDDYVDVGGHRHRRRPDHPHRAPARYRRHRAHHSVQRNQEHQELLPGVRLRDLPGGDPYNMDIDEAIKLIRDVGQKMRHDPLQRRNIWSPLEIQGVEASSPAAPSCGHGSRPRRSSNGKCRGRSTCRSNGIWMRPGWTWRRRA
jgi:hypothetical protein